MDYTNSKKENFGRFGDQLSADDIAEYRTKLLPKSTCQKVGFGIGCTILTCYFLPMLSFIPLWLFGGHYLPSPFDKDYNKLAHEGGHPHPAEGTKAEHAPPLIHETVAAAAASAVHGAASSVAVTTTTHEITMEHLVKAEALGAQWYWHSHAAILLVIVPLSLYGLGHLLRRRRETKRILLGDPLG